MPRPASCWRTASKAETPIEVGPNRERDALPEEGRSRTAFSGVKGKRGQSTNLDRIVMGSRPDSSYSSFYPTILSAAQTLKIARIYWPTLAALRRPSPAITDKRLQFILSFRAAATLTLLSPPPSQDLLTDPF